jgi:sucrose phosphorylase
MKPTWFTSSVSRLPPLLLDALVHHDAGPFAMWLQHLEPPPAGTTYFNFTASHDGIGVRPLEGLVAPRRLEHLVEIAQRLGGQVSTRRSPTGDETPYELNITYFDALADRETGDPEMHLRRFLLSQAVMLSLRGIPGVYFHSLIATRNDVAAARASGIARRINRRKFEHQQLQQALADPDSLPARTLAAYRHLLQVRTAQPAFHPDGDQSVWSRENDTVLLFLRTSPDRSQQILIAANLSAGTEQFDLTGRPEIVVVRELLGEARCAGHVVTLPPYGVAWLEIRPTAT